MYRNSYFGDFYEPYIEGSSFSGFSFSNRKPPTSHVSYFRSEKKIIKTLKKLPKGKWVRPMDIGGTAGSYHSRVLQRLTKKGLVQKKLRKPAKQYGYNRAYLYRLVQKKK